jgi:hypothetical protein
MSYQALSKTSFVVQYGATQISIEHACFTFKVPLFLKNSSFFCAIGYFTSPRNGRPRRRRVATLFFLASY